MKSEMPAWQRTHLVDEMADAFPFVFDPNPWNLSRLPVHQAFIAGLFSAMKGRWCRVCLTAWNTSWRRVTRPVSL